MHFLQAINSDLSVLIVCNKTGGTIKGDIKKINGFTRNANCLIESVANSRVIKWILGEGKRKAGKIMH